MLEKAKINNREIDLLTGGTADIDARVRALGSVISDADLDWTVDFSHRDGEMVQVVRAKHRRAPEVSPIGIKLDTVFGPEHEDLEAAFRRITEYSASEKIMLPPDVIRSFEVTGPSCSRSAPRESNSRSFPPRAKPPNSHSRSCFRTRMARPCRRMQASRGSSLTVDFYSSLEFTFLFPHDLSHGGQLRYQLDLDGTDPFVALRVLQLLDALETSTSVVMQLNGEQLARAALTDRRPVVSPSTRQDFERFRAFADDLAIVQRHCETYFSIPENVNAEDRLFVRCARLLIDGHCVVVPRMKILKAHLNGHDSPEIRGVLEADAGVFLVEHERFGFEVFGHSLMLGAARIFSPRAVFQNGTDALDALATGTADGFEPRIVPDGAESFWTYLPDRWRGGDETPRPVGWGLEDFNDPPDSLLA